ncbi:hypothetical protein LSAT2_010219 [Lamellibrachia satsuma]|nr:hypothetical protein LSAT2_010219 [Lamellibrachia satsuma]
MTRLSARLVGKGKRPPPQGPLPPGRGRPDARPTVVKETLSRTSKSFTNSRAEFYPICRTMSCVASFKFPPRNRETAQCRGVAPVKGEL